MGTRQFIDRAAAGRELAELLTGKAYENPLVLALPRGGLPVAVPIAKALAAPLDLVMVKKIGMPGHEEFAIGAIVDGEHPHLVINDDVLGVRGLSKADIDRMAQVKLEEIARRKAEYGAGDPTSVRDRTAIIVDDGIATGASMKAAIEAVRAQKPARIVIAVPVAPPSTIRELAAKVDEVVCPLQPEMFFAVGAHYSDFRQVSDQQVKDMMQEFRRGPKGQPAD
jgi:putative phosphoribosyl transferase